MHSVVADNVAARAIWRKNGNIVLLSFSKYALKKSNLSSMDITSKVIKHDG